MLENDQHDLANHVNALTERLEDPNLTPENKMILEETLEELSSMSPRNSLLVQWLVGAFLSLLNSSSNEVGYIHMSAMISYYQFVEDEPIFYFLDTPLYLPTFFTKQEYVGVLQSMNDITVAHRAKQRERNNGEGHNTTTRS